jgi:putative heme-binding domain-containing protein
MIAEPVPQMLVCSMVRPIALGMFALTVLSVTTAVLSSQAGQPTNYAASDVEAGASLYQLHCASCHGAAGDQLPSVKVLQGVFSRPTVSDVDLAAVITNGTPSELMPPTGLGRDQALQVVAFMRTRASATDGTSVTAGAPARPVADSAATSARATSGRSVFERAGCLTCHRIGDQGSRVAPDLTEIGSQRSADQIARSVTDPEAEVLPANRFYRVVTPDGTTITGRLLNHDSYTVQMIDSNDRLRSFVKASLRAAGVVPGSGMPAFRAKLSESELADLVSYLSSRRGE